MSKIKINKMVLAMTGLTVLSVGLFGYQNIVLTNQNKESIIYVAKADITANTKLTKDMFTAVSVPEKGVLQGYVTNLDSIEGKLLKGGLFKEEPITSGRVTKETDISGLELRLDADVSIPLNDNDFINVYVVLANGKNNNVEVRKLFDNKQIHKIFIQGENGATNSQNVISIRASEDEIKVYYDAKVKGQVVVVRNSNIDGGKDTTTKTYDPESPEAQNAVKQTTKSDKSEMSIVTKKVVQGDTMESLSLKYKTNADTISKLNDGKTEFNVGEDIVLPAN